MWFKIYAGIFLLFSLIFVGGGEGFDSQFDYQFFWFVTILTNLSNFATIFGFANRVPKGIRMPILTIAVFLVVFYLLASERVENIYDVLMMVGFIVFYLISYFQLFRFWRIKIVTIDEILDDDEVS